MCILILYLYLQGVIINSYYLQHCSLDYTDFLKSSFVIDNIPQFNQFIPNQNNFMNSNPIQNNMNNNFQNMYNNFNNANNNMNNNFQNINKNFINMNNNYNERDYNNLLIELNNYKNENIKLKEQINKLQQEKDKINNNLLNVISENKKKETDYINKINDLKNELSNKELIINELTKNLSKSNDKYVNYNNIMVVNFMSGDGKINCGIKCLKDDIFAVVEEKLYQQYNEYRENNNNIFIAGGRIIYRFKTMSENHIKNNDRIQLQNIQKIKIK